MKQTENHRAGKFRGKTFSCYLIAQGTLPIQCAQILLAGGHKINGVVCPDSSLADWSKERGIPYLKPARPSVEIPEFLSQQPFDYLFRIVNPYILKKNVLKLPRLGAINYHDAPLPKYAGVHATSWALIHGEKTHGISWHLIDEGVDTGDILKQVLVEIAPGETALTLNGKCYEAAIASFTELIYDLSKAGISPQPQNLEDRSYFGRERRPEAGCTISWNRPAEEIDALIRALSFGPYVNPLGMPKLAIAQEFAIVPEIEVLDSLSSTPPGTITRIKPTLQISTASYEVVLPKLLTLDGQNLPISKFVAKFGLYEGYRLTDLSPELASHLSQCDREIFRHEAFWIERLRRLEPVWLPYAGLGRASGQSKQSQSLQMTLPEEVLTFFQQYRKSWAVADLLLAVFAAYLSRIAATERFDLGYADERQREWARVPGFFSSSIPLRMEIDWEQNFAELLDTVDRELKTIRQHLTYGRELLARIPELKNTPPFSVVVQRVSSLESCQIELVSESSLTAILPEGGTECCWVYDAEIFDSQSIARMQSQFAIFASSIAIEPTQAIARLNLLSPEERHQLLVEWNDTATDYPLDKCIHQLFEEQVERTPDAVAVGFEGEELTYRQLNSRANQLAHYLRDLGVGPEVLVGICVERSLEMVVGLLGILKAGGAYVPLNHAYPERKLASTIKSSGVKLILTNERQAIALPKHPTKLIKLDRDWESIGKYSNQNITSGIQSKDLAYVIHTSGSTGEPKGVTICHRSLTNHTLYLIEIFKVSSQDCRLQFGILSSDTIAAELFPYLLSGAKVIIRSPAEESLLISNFLKTIEDEGVTSVGLPSQYWEKWVNSTMDDNMALPKSLKLVISGMDKAKQKTLKLWQEKTANKIRWYNAYGPSEATITSTFYEYKNQEL